MPAALGSSRIWQVLSAFSLDTLGFRFRLRGFHWVSRQLRICRQCKQVAVLFVASGGLAQDARKGLDRVALYGEIDLDTLTQTTTSSPRDAEGFADAFDIGAF